MHSLRAAAVIAATVCLAAGAVSAQQMDMPVRRDGHVIRPAAASGRVAEAQRQLRSEGLYRGAIDGVLTRQTRAAIADFQLRDGLPQTATLDDGTLERLRHRRTTAG